MRYLTRIPIREFKRSLELYSQKPPKRVVVVDDIEKDVEIGCPKIVWDGPYKFRCGMGTTECYIHGPFNKRS